MLILSNGLPILIFSQFLSALGYALKNLTESNLLYDSIEKSNKRNDLFARVDGKSSSFYYYIDAITSLTTGFLFIINGYLPMLLCFIICIFSTMLSLKFKEVLNLETKNVSIQKSLTDIKERI